MGQWAFCSDMGLSVLFCLVLLSAFCKLFEKGVSAMTICKLLAEAQNGRDTISAYQEWDKYSAVPKHIIVVSRDGISLSVQPTARTTWRKKFKEMANI